MLTTGIVVHCLSAIGLNELFCISVLRHSTRSLDNTNISNTARVDKQALVVLLLIYHRIIKASGKRQVLFQRPVCVCVCVCVCVIVQVKATLIYTGGNKNLTGRPQLWWFYFNLFI